MEDYSKRLRRWGAAMRDEASCADDTMHADAAFVEAIADELDRLRLLCRYNGASDDAIRGMH